MHKLYGILSEVHQPGQVVSCSTVRRFIARPAPEAVILLACGPRNYAGIGRPPQLMLGDPTLGRAFWAVYAFTAEGMQ
jgi:hypothetical protein